MKFEIKNKELKKALGKLSKVQGSRSAFPGASAVRLDADEFGGLTMSRTTPEGSIHTQCEATVEVSGIMAVESTTLADICSGFNAGDVSVVAGVKQLIIKCGRSTAKISEVPVGEVIRPHPDLVEPTSIKMLAEEFTSKLKAAHRAASNNDVKPERAGVTIRVQKGKLCAVGSDGRRVHSIELEPREQLLDPEMENPGRDRGFMIANEGVNGLLAAIGDDKGRLDISFSRCGIVARTQGTVVRLPASGCALPGIEGFLDLGAPQITITADRDELLSSCKSASPLGYGDSDVIYLRLGDGKLTVGANNQRNADMSSDIDSANSVNAGEFRMNANYLEHLIEACVHPVVTLNYTKHFGAFSVIEADRVLILMLIRSLDYTLP